MRWLLLLGLVAGSMTVMAEEPSPCASGIRVQSTGACVDYPTVEFLMLREGLCRVGWVQDTGSELLIHDLHRIDCPQEELRSYLE